MSSKIPTSKYQEFSKTAIIGKFNEYMSKLEFPAKDPIPQNKLRININLYTSFNVNIREYDRLFSSLVLSSLNG